MITISFKLTLNVSLKGVANECLYHSLTHSSNDGFVYNLDIGFVRDIPQEPIPEPSAEGAFKCRFRHCGHSYDNLRALSRHWDLTHRQPFSRMMAHIYSGCVIEPVLNRLRSPIVVHKERQMINKRHLMANTSISNRHVTISRPVNSNRRPTAPNTGQHRPSHQSIPNRYQPSAVKTSAKSGPKAVKKRQSLLKVNGNRPHVQCSQPYVCPPLVNGLAAEPPSEPLSSNSSPLPVAPEVLTALNAYQVNGSVVPIVTTPDIFSNDSSDEELDLADEGLSPAFEMTTTDPKYESLAALGLQIRR